MPIVQHEKSAFKFIGRDVRKPRFVRALSDGDVLTVV